MIVVGRVLELGYAPEGKPLLFYRGGYGRFDDLDPRYRERSVRRSRCTAQAVGRAWIAGGRRR